MIVSHDLAIVGFPPSDRRLFHASDENRMLTMSPRVHEELHARSHLDRPDSSTRSTVVNSAHVLIDDLVESGLRDQ